MLDLAKKTLLVIAPHPDDEVLGCGGLIKRVKDEGGKVYVLFLTVGDTDDYRKEGKSSGSERIEEIKRVAKFLKYDDYEIVFSDNNNHLRLDGMDQLDLMKELENGKLSLNRIKPDIVATPFFSDYNQDHRAATQALFAAARPAPNETKPLQRVVLGYESVPTAGWWDNSGHNMNLYLPLTTPELELKMKALSLYKSQIRTGSHPRSLESMKRVAFYRGIEAGAPAAEAFFSYRIIL